MIKFLLKYKGYMICLLIIVLSIISIVMQNKNRENELIVNNEKLQASEDKIGVYISGQIKNPGVYYIDKNSRLCNLLDICGGILEDADIEKLNLAQKLNDSDKITVLKKKSIEEQDIMYEDESEISYGDEDEKININTANIEELKKLNGVGDSTAKKIIEYRKTKKFNDIEDIMNVSGIGESKFNNMKDNICTN